MPGNYDRMAVTLSGMAQAFGVAGVLLIPIGLLWLITKSHWLAIVALAASVIAGIGVALTSLHTSRALSVGVLILVVYGAQRAATRMKKLKSSGYSGFNAIPLYLIIIPAIVGIAHLAFLKTAVEISRNRTISGSAAFINAIEAYRATHGRYPSTLESVHHDYDPPTVGVERYRYEPNGQSYNVFFEQPTWPIGTQEFVMYNPRDEQMMIVHNQDLLESSQKRIDDERRFHARAARDAGVAHWKYFWFD